MLYNGKTYNIYVNSCWVASLAQSIEESHSLHRLVHGVRQDASFKTNRDVEASFTIPQLRDFLKDFDD